MGTPRILVVDSAGKPVPGLTIGYAEPRARGWSTIDERLGVSDDEGSLAVARLEPWKSIRAEGGTWTTLMEVRLPPGASVPEEVSLVVAEASDVSGRVMSDSGEPLAGIPVEWRVLGNQGAGPISSARHALPRSESTLTNSDGGFFLVAVPRAPVSYLIVSAPGFERYSMPTTRLADALEIKLEPFSTERLLHVSVKNVLGLPVAGASVHFGPWSARTDSAGRCVIEMGSTPSLDLGLAVLNKGSRPVFVRGVGEQLRNSGAENPLEVRLDSEDQAIRGRVIDHDGRPVQFWRVGLVEGTDLSPGARLPVYLEDLEPENGVAWDNLPGVEVDSDGRFVLRGLLDREYTLRAWDPGKALETRVAGVAPGREVEVRIPDGVLIPSLAGRVRSLRGEPLADVVVSMTLPLRGNPEDLLGSLVVNGSFTTTGRGGEFELRNVSKEGFWLTIRGDGVSPTRRWVGGAELQDDLSITVPQLRTVVLAPSGVDGRWVRAVDSRGVTVPFVTFAWNEWRSAEELYLQPGLPQAADVSEIAEEIHVLSDSRALVAKISIGHRPVDGTDAVRIAVP